MLYIMIAQDMPNSLQKRLSARPAHVARLQALLDEGRVVLAGPMPAIDNEDPGPAGYSGSVIVAEFESLDEARAWAEADPYITSGVYADMDVRPFRQTFP